MLFCLPFISFSQTLTAKYNVTKSINFNNNGLVKTIAKLKLQGYYYQHGNMSISYLKPLYLQDYPNGFIIFNESAEQTHGFEIVMDTVINIYYANFDSLIIRRRLNPSGKNPILTNSITQFEPGLFSWDIKPDTMLINGLLCQKATRNSRISGGVAWEVWFCPDIAAKSGAEEILDLPGLMVKGENKITHTTYELETYQIGVDIPKTVFWPAEFNQPFKVLPPAKKQNPANKPKKPSLIDIINQ